MRYRLMATYRGAPFEAGMGPSADDIVLFAACPPPEDLGFEPATGHWRKQLHFSDVQAVWESRPVGVFRGERCIVLDDLGDRLHIGYLGHDGFKAEQLGYWQVDRGVYELLAPRAEVADIVEERTDIARPAAPAASAESYQPLEPAAYEPAHTGYLTPSPDGHGYTWGPEHPSGPITGGGFGSVLPLAATQPPAAAQPLPPAPLSAAPLSAAPLSAAPLSAAPLSATGYVPVPDDRTGVALPPPAQAPLPLEAEALRAASASRRERQEPPWQEPSLVPEAQLTEAQLPEPTVLEAPPQGRTTRSRVATEQLFADLAGLAGIPAGSWAVGEEVEGALCLVEGEHGFEVFHFADGARHELQLFTTEEPACFYLFGVLAADAVRTGSLAPVSGGLAATQPWHS